MPERIDELNAGIRALAEATHQVGTEVARSVQVELDKERKNRRGWFGVLLLLLIPVLIAAIASTILLLQSRERSLQNREVTRQNAQLLQRIEDCTTPGRKCYDDGQKRTAALLQKLIDAQIAVAVCSRAGTAEAEMEACVERRLASQG